MTRTIKTLLGIGSMTVFSYLATAQEADRLSNVDSSFAMKAAQGGLAEVELGKLAQTRGASDQVKQFGKQMQDDHSKAVDELTQIASKKGITLPTSPSAGDQATINKLSALNGADFDRAYMQEMVKDHQTDVAEFKTESTNGLDTDLKSYAAKTLPTLEQHLKMAQDTHKAISKDQ